MPKLRKYLRQGNITFSRGFIDSVMDIGLIPTRRNHFVGSSLVLNHGNHNPVTINDRALKFYLLNRPEFIYTCSNKVKNHSILSTYYPKTYKDIKKIDKYPVILKPIHGHHGYGIKIANTYRELLKILKNNTNYIIQEYIDVKREYRFNVFDKKIYQVSRKELTNQRTDKGGYVFNWVSLGNNAGISDKFWNFIYDIIDSYHDYVGNGMCHYCIDIMKGFDNEYYLTEINSAGGLGELTANKLITIMNNKLSNGELEKYRVR